MANDCLPPVFHKAADRNGPASDRPPDTLSGGLLHPALFFRRAVVRGTDRTGRARRFPPADSLPGKFVTCLLTYEEQTFLPGSGVDPVAIVRAMRINLSRGKVVSGGSTITMQLARIARGNRDRTLYEKMVETGLRPSPGNSLRQTSDPEPLCLARPVRRECDRHRDGGLALFRAKRRRPLVGRERHTRRPAQLARPDPSRT